MYISACANMQVAVQKFWKQNIDQALYIEKKRAHAVPLDWSKIIDFQFDTNMIMMKISSLKLLKIQNSTMFLNSVTLAKSI